MIANCQNEARRSGELLGTSRAESLSATANIFVGQTEAPLAIKPYLGRMTQSEFFAVMVGGLASIAGSVLAGYASMGIDLRFLLAACFCNVALVNMFSAKNIGTCYTEGGGGLHGV